MSNFLRSSVRSVSEKALMQKYEAGKPAIELWSQNDSRSSSVIFAPRGKHSEKPGAFYQVIERGFPEFSKIELFSRRARHGWDSWGFEAEAAKKEAAE